MQIKLIAAGILLMAGCFSSAEAKLKATPEELLLAQEQTARELRVEFNNLNADAAPDEREQILSRLIDACPDTEQAEMAYWQLCNLYLNDYDPPRDGDAADILESFLNKYPKSSAATRVKCRLLNLLDAKDVRAGELRRELLADANTPDLIKKSLR